MADKKMYKVGITVKEPWSPDISYEVLDITLFAVESGGDGCSYTAIKPNQGVTPGTDDTVWVKSTQAGQSIYDLAVKYHHFVGTEEEFEQQYQDALAAANDAAAAASATDEEIKANELSRVSAENGRVSAEQSRVSAEQSRVSAEGERVSAESARVSAESSRESAEDTRANNESARVTAENGRVSAEQSRVSAEQSRLQQFEALKTDMNTAIANVDAKAAEIEEDIVGYEANEAERVSAEQSRVSAEGERVSAESARVSAESSRESAEDTRANNESARVTAENGRVSAEQSRVSAESARVTAETARVAQASSDHTRAETDHTRAENDHTRAETDHEIAATDHAQLEAKANKSDLLNGTLVPALAGNLESWDDESLMAEDLQALPVFTTGGDISIDSSVPAQLIEIAAKTGFSATALRASGFNLLRLESDGGIARAVGVGFYFPVPALPFGTINTAEQPNGVLFTDSDGENLRPAVYFKKKSAGVPTGVTDGTACAYTDATTGGKSYRFYTTTEPGWLIVSGITHADTCAHIGWSRRYDEFISPTDPDDSGHSVNLSPVISAMHPFGKMLTVGGSADRIRRISATQVQWETECDRVKPTWTNTLQEDGETYLHYATISAMKTDGAAEFETSGQALVVSGTTVSYTDTSGAAIDDYVKYEKATSATGTVNLATDFTVEDWGLIVLLDATGEAYTTIAYAQGIPDNVRALVSARLNGQMSIVAQAFAELYAELDSLKRALAGEGGGLHGITVPVVDAREYRHFGIPDAVEGAGAPSASVVPVDWSKLCPGVVWTGIPLAPKMLYFDNVNNKWYRARMSLTGTVSDWVLLN